MGLQWWLIGVIMFITIIGIPWARACFVIGNFSLFPFGREAVSRKWLTGQDDIGTSHWGLAGNIIWFCLGGIWLIIGHLQAFAERVEQGLDEADGVARRAIIRALVKRVEIDAEQVRGVYRVGAVPFDRRPGGGVLQDCPSNTGVMPPKTPFGTMPTLRARRPSGKRSYPIR